MYKYLLLISNLLFLLPLQSLNAQTQADALMMKKNELCVATMYQHDTWNKYWEGTLFRENLNIGTLTRSTFTPMIAYGISEKLMVIAALPYVSTKASGGQKTGVSGFQDASIFLKYRWLDKTWSKSGLQSFISAGYSLPTTSYLSDYMPLHLGLGTHEMSVRGIFKYEYDQKYYIRVGAAYIHRTTTTVERDFYYADGPYYTNIMDVPSSLQYESTVGAWLCSRKLQVEVGTYQQISFSGDDIRRQNEPQPTNKMNFTNGRMMARYFPPFIKGFSFIAAYDQVFSGRNVGKSSIISGGITYQFSL